MNLKIWEVSGYLGNFNDLMIDCKDCKVCYCVDKLIEEKF